jgi:16S rRNA (uracil1498-N3)-methyltransferase
VSGFCPRFFISRPGVSPAEGVSAVPGADPGYDPGADLSGTEWTLDEKDSHHALRVLRLSWGDRCEAVMGAAVYAATVSSDQGPVSLKLTSRLERAAAGGGYRIRVGLVQAMTRPALIDHVLEKATEVGAGFIILVQTAGSPHRPEQSRPDRLERRRRIILEAAKQSKQVEVPEVEVADSVVQALEMLAGWGTFSLVLEPTASADLWEWLGPGGIREGALGGQRWQEDGGVALWVGPEGGWSAAELDQFAADGVEAARLGRSILRTETAGPVAVAAARLLLRDW